jgi:hypothetical protein
LSFRGHVVSHHHWQVLLGRHFYAGGPLCGDLYPENPGLTA